MPKPALEYLFYPRSVAIAGVSPDTETRNLGGNFVNGLLDCGFNGDVYPLHPSGGIYRGLKIYTSVKEIKGPVDYVISAIPSKYTPQLVADCAMKGVKAIHFFTAGFREIEDVTGQQLQEKVIQLAREAGIRILGPNCMGIYCPETGMTFAAPFQGQPAFPRNSGAIGLISQSGVNCVFAIRELSARNIFVSKAISYGNASDLNECDFLEYMLEDPGTKIVGMYIEGVGDGRRLVSILRNANARKPVIIYKAGKSEIGTRACASHTGSVAGSASIWKELIRQFGAIQVESMSELVDLCVAFSKLSVPVGRNIAVIGNGGGPSVMAADYVARSGLNVPELPLTVRKQLHELYGTEAGSFFRNPVDMPVFTNVDMNCTAVKIISESPNIDMIMLHYLFLDWAMINSAQVTQSVVDLISRVCKVIDKPMLIALDHANTSNSIEASSHAYDLFVKMGLLVYPSISSASNALSNYIDYYMKNG